MKDTCTYCKREIATTARGLIRPHVNRPGGEPCGGAGKFPVGVRQRRALLRAIAECGGQDSWSVLAKYNQIMGNRAFEPEFWQVLATLEATGKVVPLCWRLTQAGRVEIES